MGEAYGNKKIKIHEYALLDSNETSSIAYLKAPWPKKEKKKNTWRVFPFFFWGVERIVDSVG